MATNQAQDGRWHKKFSVPTAVTVGMPILIGTLSGVVLSLQPIPNAPGAYTTAVVDLGFDTYNLTVIGQSTMSPNTPEAVLPGDELFAQGTYDATTNVTYSLTIDKTPGNVPFGNALVGVASGATAIINVRLKGGGSGSYAR